MNNPSLSAHAVAGGSAGMRILVMLVMAGLAGCAKLPAGAPPVSSTTDIIAPDGHKVACTIVPNGVCVQP